MVSHVAIVTANKIASLKETRMGVKNGGSAQETAESWICDSRAFLNEIYTLRMS